jgi:hypothetical protein
MYSQYAKKVYAQSPNKAVIWWLEGDFEQYTTMPKTQSNGLTPTEAGQLIRDITCGIKSNEPNAIVALNHSPWLSNADADTFWSAMPTDVLDMVWVQGYGDQDKLPNSTASNETFTWLHTKTGRPIMAETSFQGSNASTPDHWTTTTAANINARIASGVIGALSYAPPANYQTTIGTLNPQLNATCQ